MKHELWVDLDGLDTFCLAGDCGAAVRSLLAPGSILEWTVEAVSHFDAMTAYYKYRNYGEYTTDFPDIDKKPYDQKCNLFRHVDAEGLINLEVALVGYQFPDAPSDDWLQVAINITQGKRTFSRSDPAIDAQELYQIHEWFKAISEHRLPKYASLCFTEPNLTFHFLADDGDTTRISIELSHELRPDFNNDQFGRDDPEWNIVFDLNAEEIEKISAALVVAVEAYPIRSKEYDDMDQS